MSQKIKIVIDKRNFIWTLLLLLGLTYLIFWFKSSKSTPQKSVILSISSKNWLKPEEIFNASINLDSAGHEVEAADFVIKFDPDFLQVKEVKKGNFFPNYPHIKKGKDKIKISGVASFDGKTVKIPKGKGKIAEIIFQAKQKTGITEITFDNKKTIIASNGINIFNAKKSQPLLLTII